MTTEKRANRLKTHAGEACIKGSILKRSAEEGTTFVQIMRSFFSECIGKLEYRDNYSQLQHVMLNGAGFFLRFGCAGIHPGACMKVENPLRFADFGSSGMVRTCARRAKARSMSEGRSTTGPPSRMNGLLGNSASNDCPLWSRKVTGLVGRSYPSSIGAQCGGKSPGGSVDGRRHLPAFPRMALRTRNDRPQSLGALDGVAELFDGQRLVFPAPTGRRSGRRRAAPRISTGQSWRRARLPLEPGGRQWCWRPSSRRRPAGCVR